MKYRSLFLIYLFFLTSSLSELIIFTSVNSSYQNIFLEDQPWYISGCGVTTARKFMFILKQYMYNWIVFSCSYFIYLYMVLLTMFLYFFIELFSMFFSSFYTHMKISNSLSRILNSI